MGFEKHGVEWPEGTSPIVVELTCMARRPCSWERRMRHFIDAVDMAFNCVGSTRRVIWNPWLDRLMEVWFSARLRDYLAIAGSSSSGKSDGIGLLFMMEYWARPVDVTAVVLSTTKQAARNRIWRSVTQFWGQAERMGCPGKLVDSIGVIKGIDARGRLTMNSGIQLKAAGKADVGQACADLIGLKNDTVLVGADEMPDLGEGITASMDNLTINRRVILAGMGNPNLFGDPFGDLGEPEAGWGSVTEADEKWKTKYGGTCIRFDGERSPRIEHPELVGPDGQHKWFWMPDEDYVETVVRNNGGTRKSRAFYRFVKAMWAPEGAGNTVFYESEFRMGNALDEREPQWDEVPVLITSLDPAFTRGGDRNQVAVGKLGKVNGKSHLHVCHEGALGEDVTLTKDPLTHQVVREWKRLADDWAIRAGHAIMDGTGSGISFGHVVDVEWSPAVTKINFNAKASDRVVMFRGEECQYYNKNSELWGQPKEFIRSGQITGISRETMAELVTREHHEKSGKTMRVEDKAEAKKKNRGQSPDRADAFLLLVEKAIQLGMFKSEEVKKVSGKISNDWKNVVRKKKLATVSGRMLRMPRR